jgi:hypothetical protein
MAALLPILQTDTFAIWQQKDNAVITAVNNLNPANIFQLVAPVNDQDIMVYDATAGLFTNKQINSFVATILAQNELASRNNPLNYFLTNQRLLF